MRLILIFLLFTSIIWGQNIKGKVLEENTNIPIEDVNIFVSKGNLGTATDSDGFFSLSIDSKKFLNDSLQFSAIGYFPKNIAIRYLINKNSTVYLSKKTEELEEVTVSDDRALRATLQYKKLASLEEGLYSFASTILDDKIYIFGGDKSYIEDSGVKALERSDGTMEQFLKYYKTNQTWESYSDQLLIYDIHKDAWTTSDITFEKRAYHNVQVQHNKFYLFGGKTLSKSKRLEYLDEKIEIYNPETKKIQIDPVNPHQAINFGSFTYKDNIIVMGGSTKLKPNGRKVFTKKSHMFNVTSGNWYELPEMTKEKEVSGVMLENKVYLVGGFNTVPLKEIESYDVLTGEWHEEGKLFRGIQNAALTAHNNIIYIFDEDRMLTFNTETHLLNEYRIDLMVKNAQLYYHNNTIYLVGGYWENSFSQNPSSDVYSISLHEFSKTETHHSKVVF